MRVAHQVTAAVWILLGMQSTANAQQVCSIIAHYFVNAPAEFVAERGEMMGTGKWRSNKPFPNASCYIREKSNHEHEASCIINSGASIETITNYGKLVERDIDSCLRQIPNGADYVKSVNDDNSDGFVSHDITWENDATDADYEIALSGSRDSHGLMSNWFAVSWRKK